MRELAPCGHKTYRLNCWRCRKWAADPAWRATMQRLYAGLGSSLLVAAGAGDMRGTSAVATAVASRPAPVAPRQRLCIHLGDPIDPPQPGTPYRPDAAGTICNCAGKWRRACDVNSECRISDDRGPQKCCQTLDPSHPTYCSRYEADA